MYQAQPTPDRRIVFETRNCGSPADTVVKPVAEPVKKTVTKTKPETVVVDAPLTAAEQEMLDEADAWVEDENGNFVPKGE